jgi:hypothetical protein
MALERPQPVIDNPVTVRAAAPLAAAGAWDAAPTEIACAGFRWAVFYVAYEEGAVGGALNFMFQYSPYSADASAPAGSPAWYSQTLYAPAMVVAGTDAISSIQLENITYDPATVNQEAFVYGPVDITGDVERLRVPCREIGVIGTPGAAEIIAVLYN